MLRNLQRCKLNFWKEIFSYRNVLECDWKIRGLSLRTLEQLILRSWAWLGVEYRQLCEAMKKEARKFAENLFVWLQW